MAYYNNAVPEDKEDIRRFIDQELRLISDAFVTLESGAGAGAVEWLFPYVAGTYDENTMTREGLWTMITNKSTSDFPAPVEDGLFIWASDLSPSAPPSLSFPTTNNTVITGCRFTIIEGGIINSYRWYAPTITTIEYELWASSEANGLVKLGISQPAVTGWQEIQFRTIVLPSSEFDLILVSRAVTQPNTMTAEWAVKNENGNPSSTEANFQNSSTQIRIHKTPKSGDATQLPNVTVGGLMTFAGIEWSIIGVTDNGAHMRFSIAPNQSRPTEDDRTITFTWGSIAPIAYAEEVGYYSGFTQVEGFIDTSYPPAATNTNLYGVDVNFDTFTTSDDWDFVAYSG